MVQIKHPIILVWFLVIFFSQFSVAQSYNVDSLFKEFQTDIQIERKLNRGYITLDEDTKETYFLLLINCPNKTLALYTNDTCAAVRYYMFSGLVKKNADDTLLQKILTNHINDTTKVFMGGGCVSVNWTLNELMQSDYQMRSKKYDVRKLETRLENLRKRPQVIIPGLDHGLISKDNFLALDSLHYSIEEYKILSFSLSKGGQMLKSSSCLFTKEMKELIEKSEPGSKLFLEEIKVRRKKGHFRYVTSILLTIN